MTEAELAAPMVEWLRAHHWEVFQEVEVPNGIADIVARQNRRLWIVEVKKTLSLSLLAQASDRQRWSHWVSVAIPPVRGSKARDFAMEIMRDRGIGLFIVHLNTWGGVADHRIDHRPYYCRERLNRKAVTESVKLYEEQKDFAPAGCANGSRFTPFQGTCKQVQQIVAERPGLKLKELIDALDHHYASESSAKSALSHWIRRGIIEGVECRREGRSLKIYPCSA